jgi:tetratricopeptide (TPR) repeat protein
MSTLDATATAVVDKIPLGRRIGEIMEERGDAFSIRAFSSRIGMNREILRVIINGERTILPSELEKIADGLGMTVERLRQLDTRADEQALEGWLQERKNLKQALALAQRLNEMAKGMTEICTSLNQVGRAHFLTQQYDAAHEVWLRALQYAEKIYAKHGDANLLHLVTANLMITYTLRQEYSNIDQILQTVETVFQDDPEKLSGAHYTRMKQKESQGDIEGAKKYAYLSLTCIQQHEVSYKIGIAQVNAAHYESMTGNYRESEQLLSAAVPNLKADRYSQLVAVKEYVKTLLQLKNAETAVQVIQEYLPRATDYPDLAAKLRILFSVATQDMTFAEQVSDDEKSSLKVRYLACRMLMNHFKTLRDGESLLRYYEKAEAVSAKPYNFLNEEDL